MTTLSEAKEAVYLAFQTAWVTTGLPYTFENESFTTPSSAWARFSVRQAAWTQDTLGRAGNRKFSRQGIATAQIFTPLNQGTAQADSLATTVKNAFEGVSLSGTTLVFRDVLVREIGPDENWYQVNVEADFEFFETR